MIGRNFHLNKISDEYAKLTITDAETFDSVIVYTKNHVIQDMKKEKYFYMKQKDIMITHIITDL